ncbi:DUF445 family protein [Xanthomonas campestris pv. raphani]|uniref:DUF445 domain-containing protein n=1 Tax=Xanthomonas campestris TaxID=339 RepID=UPI002B22EE72|nr:DUF445 family protein [Xanthomonas campestris]MEA9741129.1 DUF445 family protein [Xanthomonas campestris pv. raphani]MEA9749205.1 DUF445 family protein [Xanthomonas campestris pv. raphani]MEA9849960.1 DUF445 family protein [Xanthomonas campestris pv. raphani]MEA9931132.1 DUF445 family protein [Xanthomonas campestris pv. raphani]
MEPRVSDTRPIDPRRAQLQRMKLLAVALLLAMFAGFVVSHLMGEHGIWAWVSAFCEAATVGALADWFAVVALFRRPMGLPIPHTAILPRGKERLADGLAGFVRDQFLAPDALMEKLRVFDPASRLGEWLSKPEQARMLAQMARGWLLQALNLLDEEAVRRAIQRFVVDRLRKWNAAATAGDVMALLTTDGRHQKLLDEVLLRLGQWLDEEKVKTRTSALIVRYARREWPKLVGTVNWVKPIEEIGYSLADRMARAAIDELQDILTTPEHPIRLDYEAWLQTYIARLREEPEMAARVEELKQRAIEHPALQEYVQGLWSEIREALRNDLAKEDSSMAAHMERSMKSLGQSLSQDPSLRDALNVHMLDAADKLTTRLRASVTEHIASTMKSWDERHLVEQLELGVGRDLQYIRFNGTLVGGLIGLALHALSIWLSF